MSWTVIFGSSPATVQMVAGRLKLGHCLVAVAVLSIYAMFALRQEAPYGGNVDKEKTPVVKDFRTTDVTTREGLEARPSTIPGAANGLFTTRALKIGDFLGFFCGRLVPIEKLASGEAELTEDDFRYSYHIGGLVFVVPDLANNPKRDKLAFTNEAPHPGGGPNILSSEYVVDYEGQKYSALAFFAMKDIKAESELFIYYGQAYEEHRRKQGYTQPFYLEFGLDEKVAQDPRNVLQTIPSNCFAEGDVDDY